jgi:hypothetical protein
MAQDAAVSRSSATSAGPSAGPISSYACELPAPAVIATPGYVGERARSGGAEQRSHDGAALPVELGALQQEGDHHGDDGQVGDHVRQPGGKEAAAAPPYDPQDDAVAAGEDEASSAARKSIQMDRAEGDAL